MVALFVGYEESEYNSLLGERKKVGQVIDAQLFMMDQEKEEQRRK